MKKIFLSIAVVFGLNNAIQAQENSATPAKKQRAEFKEKPQSDKTPEERAKHGADWAEKKLGLTAEQKPKWEAASLERINANKPHHDKIKGSTTPEERKEIHKAVKANNDKFETTVNAFLTPEQKTKWEVAKKEKRKKHRAKFEGEKDELKLDLED